MQFLKFLFAIIFVELATFVLVLLEGDDWSLLAIFRLVLALFIMAIAISFWFSSMAGYSSKDILAKAKEDFASEREKLRISAEKEKRAIEKEAQKQIIKEATSTHAKANFKVGLAVAGAVGVGGLFVFAQMITLGLLVLSASGGVIGGYYWRGKRLANQEFKALEKDNSFKVIDVKELSS